MALSECTQLQDEHFHEYFSRVQEYVFELGAWGYQYSDREVCNCIINGMNLETRELDDYMSNERLLYMDPVECWDFFYFMSHQSIQVESSSLMPQSVETFETSLEDMIKDLAERVSNMTSQLNASLGESRDKCHDRSEEAEENFREMEEKCQRNQKHLS